MTNGAASTIPFLDLVSQQAEVIDDVEADLKEILRNAEFIGGTHVAAFEREYADYVGVGQCIGTANGTDAIELSLRALGVGPGDEVITAANTFVATVEAIARTGAKPVLADVDEEYLLLDPAAAAAAVTPRTKALIPVHLYGQMAPMQALAAAVGGRPLVEDAAQAQGAIQGARMAGSVGVMAATSFYPGKNLGAAGDAGAVTTQSEDLARLVRMIGNHGSERKYEHNVFGFNSRLDAMQAVVLRHKLRRLSLWNSARREAARRYTEMLSDVQGVRLPMTMPGNEHVWHLFVVRLENRNRVLEQLQNAGIGAALHYPYPVHLTPAFLHLGYEKGDFPIAEAAAESLLSLPIFPHMTEAMQSRVATRLRELAS